MVRARFWVRGSVALLWLGTATVKPCADAKTGVEWRFTLGAHHEVVVPVMVNGTGPFPFILDTGSSHSSIAAPLAERLGARAEAITTVSSLAGQELCKVVRLDRVTVGPEGPQSVLATAVSPEFLDADGRIQGVIGQDILATTTYTLDFLNRRVIWQSSTAATAITLRLRPVDGIYLVDLPQRNVTLSLIPDSGAEGLVLFDRNRARLPDFRFAAGLSWISTMTDRVAVRPITLPELRVGLESRVNQPAYLLQQPLGSGQAGDGVLPLSFFDRVTIDASRQTIAFESAANHRK